MFLATPFFAEKNTSFFCSFELKTINIDATRCRNYLVEKQALFSLVWDFLSYEDLPYCLSVLEPEATCSGPILSREDFFTIFHFPGVEHLQKAVSEVRFAFCFFQKGNYFLSQSVPS